MYNQTQGTTCEFNRLISQWQETVHTNSWTVCEYDYG